MTDDAAREQAWDTWWQAHQENDFRARGFDHRPFMAGFDAGSAATLARVVAMLEGQRDFLARYNKILFGMGQAEMLDEMIQHVRELEHGALDRTDPETAAAPHA